MEIVDHKWVGENFIVIIECKCGHIFELNAKTLNALCQNCRKRRVVEYLFTSYDELSRTGRPKRKASTVL